MRKAVSAPAVAGLMLAATLGAGPAAGSILQPSVVSEDPANFTPNVIDGGGVTRHRWTRSPNWAARSMPEVTSGWFRAGARLSTGRT